MIARGVKDRRVDKSVESVLIDTAERAPVGLFCEVAAPLVNGVVASVANLRAGLAQRGIETLLVAPRFAPETPSETRIVLPSLPLPTSTKYRCALPFLARGTRERIAQLRIVHAHSAFAAGALALRVARAHRVPLVFTYHTQLDAYAHYAPFAHAAVRRLMRVLTRAYANAADIVVAPTETIAQRLRALGVVTPIVVVPSAIDTTRFATGRRSAAVRRLLGADDAVAPLAVAVARLGAEKNLELAIDAAVATPSLRLAIVGAGPHRRVLERRAAAAGGRVRFVGALAPERLPDVYASADVLAAPSLTETQGLTLAEALAARLAVVAVDAPVPREVLGSAGRFVGPDPATFGAELLAAAAQRGPAGPAARRFTIDRHATAMLAVYARAAVENERQPKQAFGVPHIWHSRDSE